MTFSFFKLFFQNICPPEVGFCTRNRGGGGEGKTRVFADLAFEAGGGGGGRLQI